MKKILSVLLIGAMIIGCAACSKKKDDKDDANKKGEGVMTYEEYIAAPMDSEVTIEAYVQATQSWWNDQITVYLQDPDGAYFAYNMSCSEADSAKLTQGTKIKVTGYKSEWSGEVEIVDASFEIEEGTWVAEAYDMTDIFGASSDYETIVNNLHDYQNRFFSINAAVIEPSYDADGNELAFLYDWDGSGADKSDADLYFNASVNGNTYTFVIEYYLTNDSTDVYQAVTGLNIGDTITLEGFLYWYEGPQPHVTSVAFG